MSTENGNITLMDIATLGDYAEQHDMNVGALRRHVRKNPNTDGVVKFADRWYIRRNADIVLPITKTRGKQRADGRMRYVVYVAPATETRDELQLITDIVGITNVLDPRVRARERRDAKNTTAVVVDTDTTASPVVVDTNTTCYFCDNPASQMMDCDDGETHGVCDGCANAWADMDPNDNDGERWNDTMTDGERVIMERDA